MTNYITEKDLWQAIISIKHNKAIQLYNYMLSLRCRFKVIFVSYARLAAHFDVGVDTIGNWMKILKDLYLISDKKRWKKTSLYTINHLVLKFSEKYKQVFPALKYWVENALQGVYSSNPIHNTNDNNNSSEESSNNSEQSSVFFSSTVKFKADGGLDIAMTHEERMFNRNIAHFEEDMDLKKIPINKLTDEEWNVINTPKTKQQIREQKEKLTNKFVSSLENRERPHTDKTMPHSDYAHFKCPGT